MARRKPIEELAHLRHQFGERGGEILSSHTI